MLRLRHAGLRPRAARARAAVGLILTLALVASCAAPRHRFAPAIDPATLNDTAFLHSLASAPVVTVDEGARACLLLVGSTEDWPTPAKRCSELTRRGAVRARWRLVNDRLLDRGTLAHVLRTLCALPRGVNESIARRTGWGDRRYALRACVERGLLAYGPAPEPVSGAELLSAVARAESLIDAHAGGCGP
jgi:hypothetical protein